MNPATRYMPDGSAGASPPTMNQPNPAKQFVGAMYLVILLIALRLIGGWLWW